MRTVSGLARRKAKVTTDPETCISTWDSVERGDHAETFTKVKQYSRGPSGQVSISGIHGGNRMLCAAFECRYKSGNGLCFMMLRSQLEFMVVFFRRSRCASICS